MGGRQEVSRADRPANKVAAGSQYELRKGFSFRTAWSLAFADVSPIVALYAIFALALLSAGPAFWWGFPIVLAGQLLVACVFAELASRWPYEGSVYQWARHVHSTAWGWFAAWAYMWGLTIALSALSYAAAGFLGEAVGLSNLGRWTVTAIALGVVAFGSLANIIGRTILKVFVVASLTCEVLASVGLGTVLLLFYRENSLDVLLSGFGAQAGGSWLGGPFLVAVAFIGWSFLGFESAGSIAEEVTEPERNVPKALVLSLLAVGLIVMYAGLAIILAIPNLDAVLSGKVLDPVSGTLEAHFGTGIGRYLLILFVIGFTASFLAVQAAVSRAIWANARDGGLPGSSFLGKLAGPERLPVNSILLTTAGATVFVLLAGSEFYAVLVNFTTIGFYVAFGFPVVGAALARLRGEWRPGPFNFGRFSGAITYTAAAWIIFETINVVWPRDTPAPWYVDWSMTLTLAVVTCIGLVVFSLWKDRILEAWGERILRHDERAPGTTP